MTSLFDVMPVAGLPVDLMGRGVRGVSLLEFLPMVAERELVEDVPTPEPVFAVDERALQVAAMVDAAREEAGQAMREACTAEFAARLEDERGRAARVCAEAARDRAHYLEAMEAEVVKLALAVARRVLEREAEVDGKYLAAVVKAALARVQDGSTSVLRVNPGEALDWVEMGLAAVDVVGDAQVAAGECVLETSVGRVELGARPQMAEVELMFSDLTRREA